MPRRDPFLLDPEVVFLNHGSFGSCPQPVFDVYQQWQREFEREPIDLFERRLEPMLAEVRTALGDYVGAPADDLALVINATSALNAVLRSLTLGPGDEILTTAHEYGGIDRLLQYVSRRTGARVVRSSGLDAETIWAGAELCHRARDARVLSVIDGAHAPGQAPLDLDRLDADFYAGNCHKWLCAPKAAGFLHARPEVQELPSGNAEEIEHRLFEEFRIEVRVTNWDGQAMLRVSIAPYNVPEDLGRLTEALTQLF